MLSNIYGHILMLAQDGAIPLTGTNGGGDGAPVTRQGSPLDSFLPIVLLFIVVIIVFSIFSQRKEKKRRDVMLTSIKKHDTVQTIGGVVGSIVEVKDNQVVLKVDESSNTRITFARSAIQQVLFSKGEKPKDIEQPELTDSSKTP